MTWQGFESLILLSSGPVVRLEQLPRCGARFVGKGRIVKEKVPCDFVGVHVATGRAVYFDAKSDKTKTRFDVGHDDHVLPHQRKFLVAMGEGGAVSGLLVESAAWSRVYWADWRVLKSGVASVPWASLLEVGPSNRTVDFRMIVAAVAAK